MLSPPAGLTERLLAETLDRDWGVTAASVAYRPVGFGSHHWEVVDATGARWFVTADDLATKRHSATESLDHAYGRLRASLSAASDLRDHGRGFVVAPVRTSGGEPLARPMARFGIALYPYLAGQSFAWGEFSSAAHRQATLDLVIAVHTAPPAARRHARTDDFWIPQRDALRASLAPDATVIDSGPYARPAASLLAGNAAAVQRQLARYDRLVEDGRAGRSRAVLTHGEPHPGNTMLAPDGWRLIDWDTALIAPPERDLWSLDPGDGSLLAAYANATGVAPLPAMLDLYRLRWDLADLAIAVSGFREPHTGTADDDMSWRILRSLVISLAGRPG